jgi:hypothetical protein
MFFAPGSSFKPYLDSFLHPSRILNMLHIIDVNHKVDEIAAVSSLIREIIEKGEVVVVKNAISASSLEALKNSVWSWGRQQETLYPSYENFNSKNFKMHVATPYHTESRYGDDVEFDLDYTPALHMLYRLGDTQELSDLVPQASLVSKDLEKIHQIITGAKFSTDWSADIKLNLEVLHYPQGGGHMERHNHKHQDPAAKMSMILGVSKRGQDFNRGGTCFTINGETVDTSEVHDQGDLLLFASDMGHWVSPCDPELELDLEQPQGRWTAILPLYKSMLV